MQKRHGAKKMLFSFSCNPWEQKAAPHRFTKTWIGSGVELLAWYFETRWDISCVTAATTAFFFASSERSWRSNIVDAHCEVVIAVQVSTAALSTRPGLEASLASAYLHLRSLRRACSRWCYCLAPTHRRTWQRHRPTHLPPSQVQAGRRRWRSSARGSTRSTATCPDEGWNIQQSTVSHEWARESNFARGQPIWWQNLREHQFSSVLPWCANSACNKVEI